MQTDHHQIYEMVSKEEGIPLDKVKDVGNAVFRELYKKLRRPPSLILKLKGIGYWYLRKLRMEIHMEKFPPNENYRKDKPLDVLQYENSLEIYNIFKKRLEEYKEYLSIRDQVRNERNKTQSLLNEEEDNS